VTRRVHRCPAEAWHPSSWQTAPAGPNNDCSSQENESAREGRSRSRAEARPPRALPRGASLQAELSTGSVRWVHDACQARSPALRDSPVGVAWPRSLPVSVTVHASDCQPHLPPPRSSSSARPPPPRTRRSPRMKTSIHAVNYRDYWEKGECLPLLALRRPVRGSRQHGVQNRGPQPLVALRSTWSRPPVPSSSSTQQRTSWTCWSPFFANPWRTHRLLAARSPFKHSTCRIPTRFNSSAGTAARRVHPSSLEQSLQQVALSTLLDGVRSASPYRFPLYARVASRAMHSPWLRPLSRSSLKG